MGAGSGGMLTKSAEYVGTNVMGAGASGMPAKATEYVGANILDAGSGGMPPHSRTREMLCLRHTTRSGLYDSAY